MKILLQATVLFFLILNNVKGQSTNKTIEKLVENNLIEKNEVNEFEKKLLQGESKSNSGYLQALFHTEFRKMSGFDYSDIGVKIHFGTQKPTDEVQKKINEQLSIYLSRLKNSGLLTDRQFEDQTTKIKNNNYVHLFQLLPDLANQSAYEEWLNPETLILYGNQLLTTKVISERSFRSLENDIKASKITSHYQILDYCDHAIFFDLAKYSNDPAVYFEQIHKEVSKLLPELAFTNFSYKIEIDSAESFEDYTAHKVVISVKANDKIYVQKSFVSPNDIGKNGNYLGKIDDQEFYQIFNKILADHQSPYRLFEILPTYQYGKPKNFQYFGIIALVKSQVKMFRPLNSYLQLSYEKFRNSLTSDQIDKSIKLYQQIGLLNHLSSTQIEKSKEHVSEQENKNLNDVLSAFPDLIYTFDTELGNLKDPYAELVRAFKKISHNNFMPTGISDDFQIEKKKKAIVKFTIGNKLYTKVLKIEGDWIDVDFFDFIRSVVVDQHLDGQFYQLYTGGQEASIIYLTKDQYESIVKNELLLFADDSWQMEEE